MLNPNFVQRVWERCGPELSGLISGFTLQPQAQEACHLTLINSDVVSKLDSDKINAMISGGDATISDLICTGISHTVSICVVANLESSILREFMHKCNETFHLTLKPSFHITLAVLPRA